MPAARLALLLWLASASGCERQAETLAGTALELQKGTIVDNHLRGIADDERCSGFKDRIRAAAARHDNAVNATFHSHMIQIRNDARAQGCAYAP